MLIRNTKSLHDLSNKKRLQAEILQTQIDKLAEEDFNNLSESKKLQALDTSSTEPIPKGCIFTIFSLVSSDKESNTPLMYSLTVFEDWSKVITRWKGVPTVAVYVVYLESYSLLLSV